MDDETARDLAVGTADRLIYERGIRSVGMDDIRDASGVSLKRLYRLFPTKEELAVAALRHREAAFTASLAARVEAVADPRDRLLAVFDHLQAWFDEPDFRGCPFVNAWGEAGTAGGCVADAVTDQKRALRGISTDWSLPSTALLLQWPAGCSSSPTVRWSPPPPSTGPRLPPRPAPRPPLCSTRRSTAWTDPPAASDSNSAHMSGVVADWGALMARVATGDQQAFAELYDELAPTLYGTVLRVRTRSGPVRGGHARGVRRGVAPRSPLRLVSRWGARLGRDDRPPTCSRLRAVRAVAARPSALSTRRLEPACPRTLSMLSSIHSSATEHARR